MGSVNKWIGIGNLGADPELKYTATSRAVTNFSVACNEVWKDKAGQRQEKTEWIRITVWGDQAENCAKYLSKGRSVYVEGRLETTSYEKNGQKHYSTQVVADRVVFLAGGQERSGQQGQARGGGQQGMGAGAPPGSRRASDSRQPPDDGPSPPIGDDDIPF